MKHNNLGQSNKETKKERNHCIEFFHILQQIKTHGNKMFAQSLMLLHSHDHL